MSSAWTWGLQVGLRHWSLRCLERWCFWSISCKADRNSEMVLASLVMRPAMAWREGFRSRSGGGELGKDRALITWIPSKRRGSLTAAPTMFLTAFRVWLNRPM